MYLILIATQPILQEYDAPIVPRYALTTTYNPAIGLENLRTFCPVALTLLHSIHAGSRTDLLKKTLEIKFRPQHLHSFWYAFKSEHLDYIKAINSANVTSLIGLIHKELKPAEMTSEETQAFIKQQINRAASLLTK